VRISPDTGLLARADDGGAIFETFRVEQVPAPEEDRGTSPYEPQEEDEQLF
jgi:hypothetical protein